MGVMASCRPLSILPGTYCPTPTSSCTWKPKSTTRVMEWPTSQLYRLSRAAPIATKPDIIIRNTRTSLRPSRLHGTSLRIRSQAVRILKAIQETASKEVPAAGIGQNAPTLGGTRLDTSALSRTGMRLGSHPYPPAATPKKSHK